MSHTASWAITSAPPMSYTSIWRAEQAHHRWGPRQQSSPVPGAVMFLIVSPVKRIDANKFSESFLHELHRNKFVNSVEKWKTNRTWLNSCENVAYTLLETYRSRQATLGGNRQNSRGGATCDLCMLFIQIQCSESWGAMKGLVSPHLFQPLVTWLWVTFRVGAFLLVLE